MNISKTVGWTAVVGLLATLGGCANAPIPLAQNFELTSQYKVRSAGHWDLVSRDVVSQTAATLDKAGVGGSPVYVSLPARPSAFDQGFREFLITKMVQGGKQVLTAENPQALQVSYQTQVVRHNSPRPHFIPGVYTMLASGLGVAYGLRHEHLDMKLIGVLGLAGIADYTSSINSGGPTATELILTTTVTRGGQYVSRKTDVYYLETADTPLFVNTAMQSVTYKVVSQ